MIDNARPRVLPKLVVVSMSHCFDEPCFVIRGKPQRSGPRSEWKVADVFSRVGAKLEQFSDAARVCGAASGCERCIRRTCCIPECEDPVEEAKFERAVMADSVPAEVRHGVDRDHCFHKGCVCYRQCVLRSA